MSFNKLNAAAQEIVIDTLRRGGDMSLAARRVSCSRNALYKLRDRSDKFREACDEARAFADDVIVSKLYSEAMAGNTTAMIFWLKNRKPYEWRDRHDLEVRDKREGQEEFRAHFASGDEAFVPPVTVPVPKGPPN